MIKAGDLHNSPRKYDLRFLICIFTLGNFSNVSISKMLKREMLNFKNTCNQLFVFTKANIYINCDTFKIVK